MNRLDQLRQWATDNPEDPFYPYAIYLEIYTQGEIKEAIMGLENLQKRFPEYLPIYYQLAVYLIQEEKFDQASKLILEGIMVAKRQNQTKVVRELQQLLQEIEE